MRIPSDRLSAGSSDNRVGWDGTDVGWEREVCRLGYYSVATHLSTVQYVSVSVYVYAFRPLPNPCDALEDQKHGNLGEESHYGYLMRGPTRSLAGRRRKSWSAASQIFDPQPLGF